MKQNTKLETRNLYKEAFRLLNRANEILDYVTKECEKNRTNHKDCIYGAKSDEII